MSVSRYPEQFTEAQCCDDNGYCRRSVIVPQAGRHNGMGILSQSHVRDEPALIRDVHLTCYVKENNSQCLSLDVHSIVPIPAYHLPRIAAVGDWHHTPRSVVGCHSKNRPPSTRIVECLCRDMRF